MYKESTTAVICFHMQLFYIGKNVFFNWPLTLPRHRKPACHPRLESLRKFYRGVPIVGLFLAQILAPNIAFAFQRLGYSINRIYLYIEAFLPCMENISCILLSFQYVLRKEIWILLNWRQ
jgi:hypothetical protein